MDFRLDDEQLALQEAVADVLRRPLSARRRGRARGGAGSTGAPWQELADLGVFSLLVPEARRRPRSGPGRGRPRVRAARPPPGRRPARCGRRSAPAVLDGVVDGDAVVGRQSTRLDGRDDDPIDRRARRRPRRAGRSCGPTACSPIERAELPEATSRSSRSTRSRRSAAFAALPDGHADRRTPTTPSTLRRPRAPCWPRRCCSASSESALDVARDYSLEREQFDRPIGSFQALKHLMADMYVRTDLARSATYAAAAVLDDPRVGDGPTRGRARPSCWPARPRSTTRRAAVQVLGGMGFTWDMPPELPAQAGLGARADLRHRRRATRSPSATRRPEVGR